MVVWGLDKSPRVGAHRGSLKCDPLRLGQTAAGADDGGRLGSKMRVANFPAAFGGQNVAKQGGILSRGGGSE